MHRIYIISIFCIFSLGNIQAQHKAIREAGFFFGSSYYLGDINPTRQFYSPSLSLGGLVKIYLDDRQCLRFHGLYGHFKGNDKDFNNMFQLWRNESFSVSMLDVNAIYEFNFLSFRYDPRKITFSPFLFGGMGYEILLQAQTGRNHFSIPFGTGIKYMISKKTTIGVEWSFRKTFADNLDHITNPGGPQDKSIISNNDWYSFAGFFITFRLFDHGEDCPVYKQARL